jgi:ubiquinone/menaquinone biosynthesis C-methylase UbiE
MVERWQDTYSNEDDIYANFCKYEDEGDKVLKKLLKNFSFKNKVVLEIGCGSGKYTQKLAPMSKKYFALDLSKQLIETAKNNCKNISNVDFINCSAENIPLENESVDVVFASWVVSATGSKKIRDAVVKDILRVLKKDGHIWLFENYWEGEFTDLRGLTGKPEKVVTYRLLKEHPFEIFKIVDTNFCFPSLKEAKRMFGFIIGCPALDYLSKHNNPKIKHKVLILHRKKL